MMTDNMTSAFQDAFRDDETNVWHEGQAVTQRIDKSSHCLESDQITKQ